MPKIAKNVCGNVKVSRAGGDTKPEFFKSIGKNS